MLALVALPVEGSLIYPMTSRCFDFGVDSSPWDVGVSLVLHVGLGPRNGSYEIFDCQANVRTEPYNTDPRKGRLGYVIEWYVLFSQTAQQ